jgi:hypothetical protein
MDSELNTKQEAMIEVKRGPAFDIDRDWYASPRGFLCKKVPMKVSTSKLYLRITPDRYLCPKNYSKITTDRCN